MIGSDDEATGDLPRPFGSYTLLALLGRGGMGEVYLASKEGVAGISRRCVVKTLRAGFGDDLEYVTRFLDEARVVVQLHHRNICPVFEVGKVGARHFLAMEYIAGRDLRTVAQRARDAGSPLDAGLALHIVSEVLEALDYAHTLTDPASGQPLQLVHRDVSPHNVMVGFDGDTRLIDFGLAASTLKVEQTAPNMVMGKVAYMSREQVCADELDHTTDQFAAAILAYELYVGERFYEGRKSQEVFNLAAQGGFRPVKFSSLPEALRAILDRALQTDRRRRYPSCAAMREDIDAFRYDNHLRGDVPALRALMRKVFAADIQAERALLARMLGAQSGAIPASLNDTSGDFAQPAAPLPEDAPASASSSSSPPLSSLPPSEPTERSRSGPARQPGDLHDETRATISKPVAAPVANPNTTATEIVARARRDGVGAGGHDDASAGLSQWQPARTRAPVLAVAAGALGVAIAALLVVAFRPGPEPVAPAPVDVTPPPHPAPAPTITPSTATTTAPVEPSPAVVAPPVDDAASAAAAAQRKGQPDKTPKPERPPKGEKVVKVEKVEKVVKVEKVDKVDQVVEKVEKAAPVDAPPVESLEKVEKVEKSPAPKRPPPPSNPVLVGPRIEYLMKYCGKELCAQRIAKKQKTWATEPPPQLESLKGDIAECLERCAPPG
jgi:serine/threonine protein kinase